jgi:glycosyltransferase involved in cell wall biosynthesis
MIQNFNKKVLIFPVWYGMGGSTMYVSQYVSYLVSNKYEVYVVCRKKDKGSSFLKDIGAKPVYIYFPFTLNFTALDELNNSLKKILIDIIKLFGGFFISLSLLLIYRPGNLIIGEFCEIPVLLSSSLFRNKTICFFQTTISSNKWKRFILFRLLKNINHLVGITDLHTFDVPYKDKICTVPNFYPNIGISSTNILVDKLNLNGDRVVLFMGGVSKIKGTRQFIEIALELIKLRKDLCFVIAGSFHKSFQTKYGIGENDSEYDYNKDIFDMIGDFIDIKFKFLGEINYTNNVLKHSALFISANTYPHFSRPIVEAWANKVPVVANEDLFTKYMCHDSDSILFIDFLHPDKSAIKINDLLNNTKNIEKQVSEGYCSYRTYYSQEVATLALDKLFKETV